ncbi:uncharacterized protein LOC135933942 [Cloeon dipterum]|uniref:uncharacterized protein LOC135933942 n=1 Tax=Cloeon dipterum TaxID=197152 RepID=UPI0032208DEF
MQPLWPLLVTLLLETAKCYPDQLGQQKSNCQRISLNLTTLPNGNKYFIPRTQAKYRMNWYQAKDFCANNSMHLASPKNQNELSSLYRRIKEIHGSNTKWWLSASDVGRTTGDFRWHDGRALPKDSSMWYADDLEPDSFGKGFEACVNVATYKRTKLTDDACTANSENYYFVCEPPAGC